MNKTYKTFAELYAARPKNDLPFVIKWEGVPECECIYPLSNTLFCAQWEYSNNIHGPLHVSDLGNTGCEIVDEFDKSPAPVNAGQCGCTIIELMGGCRCEAGRLELERERAA